MDNQDLVNSNEYLMELRRRRREELRQQERRELRVLVPRPCPYCGALIYPLEFEVFDKARQIEVEWCTCELAQLAKENQESKREKARIEGEFKRLWDKSGAIGGEYDRMTFEEWDEKRHPKALSHLKDTINYCVNVSDTKPNMLYLYGLYGRGKTHLGIAALRKITQDRIDDPRGNLTPYFVEWLEHCSKVQATWDKDDSESGPTEDQLWRRMKGAGILQIDDIDKGRVSEWAMSKLLEVVQWRYMRDKPLIITSNHSLLELEEYWTSSKLAYVRDTGAAICSRLSKMLMKQIHVVGEDQRDR